MAASHSPTTPRYLRARRYARQGTRSQAELAVYLTRIGADADEQREVLRRLRAEGWVDDRAVAALIAESLARRGYAAAAIQARLRSKGLAPAVIERALGPASTANDRPRGRAAAQGYAQRLARAGVTGRRASARLARWLAARGFDESLIEELVHELGVVTSD